MILEKTFQLFLSERGLSTEEMMKAEKKRRGYSKEELIFLGMANLAKYYWCAQKCLFESKYNEEKFFVTYLFDNIRYKFIKSKNENAVKGNSKPAEFSDFLEELPENEEDFLSVTEDIDFNYVQNHFKEIFKEKRKSEYYGKRPEDYSTEEGGEYRIPESWGESILKKYNGEKDPITRGKYYENLKARNYPTMRWNFEWGKYVIIGAPNGVTDEIVYEFKTTKNEFLSNFQKRILPTQVDLYGYFFERDITESELYIIEDDEIEFWKEDVNIRNAEMILNKFKSLNYGEKPIPPKEWKCNNCKYVSECPVKQNQFMK